MMRRRALIGSCPGSESPEGFLGRCGSGGCRGAGLLGKIWGKIQGPAKGEGFEVSQPQEGEVDKKPEEEGKGLVGRVSSLPE